MSDLLSKRCLACEGGVAVLEREDVDRFASEVPEWDITQAGKQIQRQFSFANYYQTMAFVNAIAWLAHTENHHPEMQVGFRSCTVIYSTHAVQGLTENDFICAAKVNQLFQND